MRLERDGKSIRTVCDWHDHAPPKSRIHWKEGRSACELAQAWCSSGEPRIPAELRTLFDSHSATRNLSIDVAFPEHRIAFDNHGGEPCNADLAFVGTVDSAKVAVVVEAKADEPFGPTIQKAMAKALERRLFKQTSRGVERIVDLVLSIAQPVEQTQPSLDSLRYQLFTGVAGALALAQQSGAATAVFVVHEFATRETRDDLRARNSKDLRAFLTRIVAGDIQLPSGSFVGPIQVPGRPLFTEVRPLFIGKARVDRR